MMKDTTSFEYVIYIRATAEQVFDAIIKPELARQYWGHENVSNWTVDSRWEHVSADDDRTVNIVGEVIAIRPPHHLVITWAGASEASNPEKYSQVTFSLTPYEGMVRLTVSHDELEAGSGMASGIAKGWPIVLSSLKSWLETNRSLDVFAAPVEVEIAA